MGIAKKLAISAAVALAGCGGNGSDSGCTPQSVTVQIQGDSIGEGSGATTVAGDPAVILRTALTQRWPTGVTVVQTSRSGAATADRINGTHGVPPYPTGVVGNVYLTNYGVNDALQGVPVATYKANLKRLAGVPGAIIQTPTPTVSVDTSLYALAARQVAAELGLPLADVNAYVLGLPNWQSLLPDGVHPGDALYQQMMGNVVVPVVIREAAKLKCE